MTPSGNCPECGAAIPDGRLSCPTCGALLAAVRGRPAATPGAQESGVDASPTAATHPGTATGQASRNAGDGPRPATVAPHDAAAAAAMSAGTAPLPVTRASEPAPSREAASARGASAPAGPAMAIAGDWHATRQAAPDKTQPQPVVAGRAPMLSDLPFEAPDTPAGWMAAVGTWLVALAFPLPWVSSPLLGWFAAWGFNPTLNVVPFGFALLAAFATITPSRVPLRVRLGYLPLVVGLVAFGMAWSWILLVAPAIGLVMLFFGAVLAAAGGGWTLTTADKRSRLL
jgi:hypothetical protein